MSNDLKSVGKPEWGPGSKTKKPCMVPAEFTLTGQPIKVSINGSVIEPGEQMLDADTFYNIKSMIAARKRSDFNSRFGDPDTPRNVKIHLGIINR